MKYLPLEFETTRNEHINNYSDGYLAKGDGQSGISEVLTRTMGGRWIT